MLGEALRRDPTSPSLHRLNGLVLLSLGDHPAGLAEIATAEALVPGLRSPKVELIPEDFRWVRLQGLRLRRDFYPRRPTETAIALARELRLDGDRAAARNVLSEFASHPEVKMELARWAIDDGESANALELLAEITSRTAFPRPLRSRAWAMTAVALDHEGEVDDALEAAHSALRLDPRSSAPYVTLAGLAQRRGDSTAALEHLRRAWGMAPTDTRLLVRIAAVAEESRPMYGHGFSMLFLAQIYGMEEDKSRQRRIQTALHRGIQLIARSQSRDGGWLYTPDAGGDEGSVTITQVQALRACRNAGLHVPKKVIDLAIKYIERSQQTDGGIAYRVRSSGSRPAITAAACAVLYNAGSYDSPAAEKCFKYAWRHCQPTGTSGGHYYYTQLYMSQAVWQKGNQYWNKYYPKIQQYMLRMQQGNGSWRGDGAGLVYGTAIALLILQVPYSNLPILSR